MSLRRTPGVICQCQSGSGMDGGTHALTLSGLPGPTTLAVGAHAAARTIYSSVSLQSPVCMEWSAVRAAGQLARTATACTIESNLQLSLDQAVYGFAVRQVAEQYLNVRETGGDNRGEEVEAMLEGAGGAAGMSWCAAFVSHCHVEAANFLCADTTCPRTLSAVMMVFLGRTAGNLTFSKASVLSGAITPFAGDVFSMVHQGPVSSLDPGKPAQFRRGHTGIVVSYNATTQTLVTIEGNTNEGGGREGNGVYLRTDRMRSARLWGFMRPRIAWL
ncbi:MAG: hypothetical protein DYG94_10545 [Leptolyngbya sp. PLA3]|nr:MAG: hypothetical protein EDM82_09110 [Cyanobacteria bacterium CYA]MCE7969170.1 hypothetical protein [Leptolyngbya sp. PL-A3]